MDNNYNDSDDTHPPWVIVRVEYFVADKNRQLFHTLTDSTYARVGKPKSCFIEFLSEERAWRACSTEALNWGLDIHFLWKGWGVLNKVCYNERWITKIIQRPRKSNVFPFHQTFGSLTPPAFSVDFIYLTFYITQLHVFRKQTLLSTWYRPSKFWV